MSSAHDGHVKKFKVFLYIFLLIFQKVKGTGTRDYNWLKVVPYHWIGLNEYSSQTAFKKN